MLLHATSHAMKEFFLQLSFKFSLIIPALALNFISLMVVLVLASERFNWKLLVAHKVSTDYRNYGASYLWLSEHSLRSALKMMWGRCLWGDWRKKSTFYHNYRLKATNGAIGLWNQKPSSMELISIVLEDFIDNLF